MPGNAAAAGASYGDLLVTSLLVLGAVCVAAFVAVRLFGRLIAGATGATGRARRAHLLNVVARVPLEPRRSLYVVEVAGKTLLVGTSEMGLSVLSELDGSEVKSRVQAQQSFGELVRAAWQRRKARKAAEPAPAPSEGPPMSATETTAAAPPSSSTTAATPPSSSTTAATPLPSSTTAATLPSSSTTAATPLPSSTTAATLPSSSTTAATPLPSSTPAATPT